MKQGKKLEMKREKITTLTFNEHVRKRPNVLGDSTIFSKFDAFIVGSNGIVSKKEIDLPLLVTKCFKEILSNATDNYMRSRKYGMDGGTIEVILGKHEITITNTGLPIDLSQKVFNRKENKSTHSIIALFGTELTGTNFNDNNREYSGANGIGAKLTNIMSTLFEVDACDGRSGVLAVWKEGMTNLVSFDEYKTKESYTRINWTFDFGYITKFSKNSGIKKGYRENDLRYFMYVCSQFAMAARCKIKVRYGNEVHVFKFAGITDFVKYLYGNVLMCYDAHYLSNDDRKNNKPNVEVVVLNLEEENQSYVNGIETCEGGIHVDVVAGIIRKSLVRKYNEEMELEGTTAASIKKYISFIILVNMNAPVFTSQAKHKLDGKKTDIEYVPSRDLMNKLYEDCWIWKQKLNDLIIAKQEKEIYKQKMPKAGTKFEEANKIGKKNYNSTLWLVEGASASNYIKKLFDSIEGGRDTNGYYCLKGKPINSQNRSIAKLLNNAEVRDIVAMLGTFEKDGVIDMKRLRYSSVVIASDADNDGAHIRCLVINLFSVLWPTLLKNGFLKYLETPIVRVCKGKKTLHSFIFIEDYEEWAKENTGRYDVKHFKGLGSSSDRDIQEDAKNCRRITCVYDRKAEKYINLCFDTDSDVRKEWIITPVKPVEIDYANNTRNISNILNHDLKIFSLTNIIRALPDCRDFLKISFRQIIYTIITEWNYGSARSKSMKLTVAAGMINEKMIYEHGQDILAKTLCGLLGSYTGSNNLTFAEGEGQFGSRDSNGDDCAAPRYLFVNIGKYMKFLYREDLIACIPKVTVEGVNVQPEWLPCCIPLGLINGLLGVGTGWSSKILAHRPSEICAFLIHRCEGKTYKKLVPWYKGFTGKVALDDSTHSVTFTGKFNEGKRDCVNVTEIPIPMSLNDYKNFLKDLIEEKKISRYDNCCNLKKNKIHFKLYGFTEEVNVKSLGLIKQSRLTNMTVIELNGIPKIHFKAEDILENYYGQMIIVYGKMIANTIKEKQVEHKALNGKYKYLKFMVENSYSMSTPNIIELLKQNDIDIEYSKRSLYNEGSQERLKEILKSMKEIRETIAYYEDTTAEKEWKIDLENLKIVLDEEGL